MLSMVRKGSSVWRIIPIFLLLWVVPSFGQVRQDRAVNLEALNTPFSEVAPIVSADGNTMYFTSDRDGGVGRQDFWMSRKVGGEWTEPVNVRELNTPQNEGPDALTADGKTMYYTGCNRREDGSDKCDIYVTYLRKNGKWTPGNNMGPPINTDNEEANATISPDGKTLYFASDRPGGQGGYDLWMSNMGRNGRWSEPVNIGPNVNTPAWEGVAFAHANGTTLYFSSNGHGGFGNADTFRTERQPDGTWSEPVNMGGLINSAYNDIYFTFPASGDLAYFSSSSEEGLGREDIYAIPKNLILDSPDFVIVRGRVTDATTNKPLAAMLTITGGDIGRLTNTSNPRTGNYNARLQIGGSYRITASAQGYMDRTEVLDLTVADPFHIVVRDIPLSPIMLASNETTETAPPEEIEEILINGGTLVVRNVLFDFDKYYLKEDAIPVLEKLIDFMKNNPSVVLKVDGYTDSFGPTGYNMKLSIRRAKAVKEYMSLRGVSAGRIVTEGHGETHMVAPDDLSAPEGNPKNRRVEFSLVRGTYHPTANPETSMNGKQPPDDVVVAQVASLAPYTRIMPPDLVVHDGVIATDVVDRIPINPGNVFPAAVGRLYYFTRVVGATEDIQVKHIWYRNGRVFSRVYLDVNSPSWRTWSYVNIPSGWSGSMRVECVGPDGRALDTARFTLKK